MSFDWWYQRIYYRNIAMLDKSDFSIFYVIRTKDSGAYKAFEYALKKKKDLINLGCIKK